MEYLETAEDFVKKMVDEDEVWEYFDIDEKRSIYDLFECYVDHCEDADMEPAFDEDDLRDALMIYNQNIY